MWLVGTQNFDAAYLLPVSPTLMPDHLVSSLILMPDYEETVDISRNQCDYYRLAH